MRSAVVFLTGGKFTLYQPIILYRKFSADYIFNGYELLQNQVLITNEAGVIVELIREPDAGDGIEKLKGILSPGLINVHCHLELSHMKGMIPKHTGLVDFILRVVNERHVSEDEILTAMEAAENDMLHNGIVAVGDICNNTLSIPQKTRSRLIYHNFIEASGFIPAYAKERFNKTMLILGEFQASIKGRQSSVGPHAPYSVSPEMFRMINDIPGNNLITIHNQESASENEFFRKGGGDLIRLYQQMGIDISFFTASRKSSLQTWLPCFTKEQSMILVHNVMTSVADMEFANSWLQTPNSRLFFCLCPNANLFITNRLPDVHTLMRHTNNIVLGTDSLASNDRLSILDEIKTLQHHFKDLDLVKLLQWATINGSRALQMQDTLGSFEKGKQPGLVLIESVEGLRLNDNSSAKRIL